MRGLLTTQRVVLNETGHPLRGIMPITPMMLAWIELAVFAAAEHGIQTSAAFTEESAGRTNSISRMQDFVTLRERNARNAWVSFGKEFQAQWMTDVFGEHYAGIARKGTVFARWCHGAHAESC